MRRLIDFLDRLWEALIKSVGMVFGGACFFMLIEHNSWRGAIGGCVVLAMVVVGFMFRSKPAPPPLVFRVHDDETERAVLELNRAVARVLELAGRATDRTS